MSKKDLHADEATHLPVAFYTVAETAYMVKLEYERVLQAIHAEEIPAEKFGRTYRVPAWWVNKHLTGVADDGAVEARRAS